MPLRMGSFDLPMDSSSKNGLRVCVYENVMECVSRQFINEKIFLDHCKDFLDLKTKDYANNNAIQFSRWETRLYNYLLTNLILIFESQQ